ncbi:MAG: hypothetical protein EP347_08855 [Alphaproteobacteria bacterium]|nr:MAG: hypothetical protein EP347_08855 [Alphaproteobacteria bacterium]
MWALVRQGFLARTRWRKRGGAIWSWLRAHGRAIAISAVLHLFLLLIVQLELGREKLRFQASTEIPIELVVLAAPPPAEEAPVEEEVPGAPTPEAVADERDRLELRLRPLPNTPPGPNVEGFRRFILALECTPDMAASSAEMNYACRRVAEILADLTAEEVVRLKARAAGLAYARGWALPPPGEELEQETIRKDTEKGAPGEDVMGPWPWE